MEKVTMEQLPELFEAIAAQFADNADLFLERVIGFNVAAYGSLHGIQGSADFRNPGQLSRLYQDHLDGG